MNLYKFYDADDKPVFYYSLRELREFLGFDMEDSAKIAMPGCHITKDGIEILTFPRFTHC